jgi:xanthine/uracil/vitamin C permease (AzgA family)
MVREYIVQNVPIIVQAAIGAMIGMYLGKYIEYLIKKYLL